MPDRRTFVREGSALVGALALGADRALGEVRRDARRSGALPSGPGPTRAGLPPRALDILMLGGTGFLGPLQVHLALERGHTVTIFTRGRTEPRMYVEDFAHVEHLIGDRATDLSALEGRRWDVVIDTSTREIGWAEASTRLLRDTATHYVFVSSTGVYYPYLGTNLDEDAPVLMEDSRGGRDGSMTYGVMKARGEQAARDAFGDRAIVLRPGHIVGPGDSQPGRFCYWTTRMERGGEVLAPGLKTDPVQLVDARDLIRFMFQLFESGRGGTYNVVGPASPMTMEAFLYGMRACTSAPVRWVWADDHDWLAEQGVRALIPWLLPRGEESGHMSVDPSRAQAAGLELRPLATTTLDVMAWWRSDAVPAEVRENTRFPLTPERERGLIAAWRSRG